jgi:glutathione S-transferase
MTTVYGVPLSPFARKVMLSLDLKGIEYDVVNVTPMNKPEGFEALSPLGKIPAFKDDLLAISDSSVICDYLEERYPDVSLRPGDLVERARSRWLEEYADTKLAEVTGPPVFFERVVKQKLLQQDCDEQRVQDAMANLIPPVFDYLEDQVPGAQFIHNVGQEASITLSDLAIVAPLINLYLAGESIDASRWPKLSAYYNFLVQQPVIARHIEGVKGFFG